MIRYIEFNKYMLRNHKSKIINRNNRGRQRKPQSDEEYEEMTVEFKKIADTFLEEDREHNSVATIIDRYRNTL